MSNNVNIIQSVENGLIKFGDFEHSQPLQPNLLKSQAAKRLFKSLMAQYQGKPSDTESWLLFIEWAVKYKILTQQSKTWRITKSRLKNIFEHPIFLKKIDDVEKTIYEDHEIQNIESLGSNSTKKAKYIPIHVSNALIRYLRSSKSSYSEAAVRWMKVSLITGMRGVEWARTDYLDNNGHPYLRIVNTTKGSPFATRHSVSLPPIRNFPLAHLSPEDLSLIKEHLLSIKEILNTEGTDGFNKHYEAISNLIYLQNRKLPDEAREAGTYGIYSCRHQVIANMKASKRFTIEAIGRMMGQSTRRITERTYAKAKVGYSSDLPVDDIDE